MKKYLIGFILGFVSVGIVAVYAETYFPSNDVTYDNTQSGLQSTTVQGAIDELYTECTTTPAGEQIIEDAGLEKDQYECRYFFTGANPNNYITFNDEQAGWRIISVECDGTIKIMKNGGIGNRQWDSSGNGDWARPASLNTYLNETYYNRLNSIAQRQIVVKDFSIGRVTYENDYINSQIQDENSKTWSGKIALITVSEYIRTNSDKNNCGTFKINNINFNNCANTGWMDTNSTFWTLTPGSSSLVYWMTKGNINNYGGVNSSPTLSMSVRPALYLSSDIKIMGGTGTYSDPYQISL